MRYGRYTWSYRMLRWGLGLTFLWIGLDMFRTPDAWIGYLPPELPEVVSRRVWLALAGIVDVVLGVLLLLRLVPKLTGALVSLHLVGIILTQGIDAVLVRDIGLLGAALALWLWPVSYHRKRRGRRVASIMSKVQFWQRGGEEKS